ncbi:MAG: SUMF1/EgtB/PvdO family nonheme iron enzyme [Thermoflexales bacterium]|nr:SUMF1/EgtB/PvdO family nonheme iron enzyme [Thermoflexales bacterium]
MSDDSSSGSATNVSGGVNVAADQVTINGDVAGRDKIVSAGGHVITAGAGATVNIGVLPASEPEDLSPTPGDPPFKGLQYFDETDADLFFGREELSAQLAARLRPETFLAIVGASGSGKSSIVRAGMIPALRRDHPHWQIHLITPTAHPLKELATSLTRTAESVTAAATLIDDLMRDARSLDLAAARALKTSNPGERLLLVVDQFEELFTTCKDEREQRAFVDNLMHAVASTTSGPVIIVITLRADFYAPCARFDLLRQALEQHQAYIGPMTEAELRRAIETPAQRAKWQFQPGLVDLMLHDVGREPGALPLLSHALLATWNRRRRRTLTLEGYREAGGVNGAIATTADEVVRSLSPDSQAIARQIFLRLTELGEGTQDTRRRATLNELISRPQLQSQVETVLKTLADARLVTTDQNTTEVAHEALIREWPLLRGWLDEDREGLRLHRQLTDDAQHWIALQRDEGALYRGMRLSQILDWQRNTPTSELNEREAEFIKASQTRRDRDVDAERERRRLRWLLAIVVNVGLLAAVILLVREPLRQDALRQQAMVSRPMSTIPGSQSEFDTTPVTNGQYRGCVEAGQCSEPGPSLSTYFDNADGLPVTGLDALQAQRYCDWLGRRLPYLSEWQSMLSAFPPAGDSDEVHGLGVKLNEWTATSWPDYKPWDGQTATLPKRLVEVGADFTALGEQAKLDFRNANLGFRCARSVSQ